MSLKKYIRSHNLIICGSVDDGKSSLIGKLIFELNALYKDQVISLEQDTKKYSNLKNQIDYSLIMDGLISEREQAITIDIAFKSLTINKVRYNICDSPGHLQYTKNMAAAASICDVAILLVNAKKGITVQTRRHLYLLSLFKIKSLAVIVNKIDLINYSKAYFLKISDQLNNLLTNLNFEKCEIIPCSATKNINILKKSLKTKWYDGATLLDFLLNLKDYSNTNATLYSIVQGVVRNNKNVRYYLCSMINGVLKEKSDIFIFPSKEKNRVKNIFSGKKNIKNSKFTNAISFTTNKETDISRGNIISNNKKSVTVSNKFLARIIWTGEEELYDQRVYYFYRTGFLSDVYISKPFKKINFNSFSFNTANIIKKNDICEIELNLIKKLSFTSYEENKFLGSFILVDKMTKETLGAGVILNSLEPLVINPIQRFNLSKKDRSIIKKQTPFVLWFTGISGSGKTTIASIVEVLLNKLNKHTYILDGDNIRNKISKDLSFTKEDRIENIRRVSEMAKLFVDAGIITIVALISPFKAERHQAKSKFEKNEFFEIFINTSLETTMKRDPKKLYEKTIKGEVKNMTSISSPYEPPEKPFIEIKTEEISAQDAAKNIVSKLRSINAI